MDGELLLQIEILEGGLEFMVAAAASLSGNRQFASEGGISPPSLLFRLMSYVCGTAGIGQLDYLSD